MNPNTVKDPEFFLDGARYRQSHKASVMSVLGSDAPAVYSQGSRFYNRDRWTLRSFTSFMCAWAKDNPKCVPTQKDIADWVTKANAETVIQRQIVIAATPDKLPIRMACALTGGGYHEAFHTYYSRRIPLQKDEMLGVLPRWALVANWAKYYEAIQNWANVIEDIRIERVGREEFEGTFVPLCDLQDFILAQEAESDAKEQNPARLALSIILRTFRDVGLGYNTTSQQNALQQYQAINKEAFDFVVKGPLSDLLRETIALDRYDSISCLWIAMDVIAKITELAKENQEDEQPQQGQGFDGCPQCGAPKSKLKLRPKANGSGGKVPGKGIITCTVCGWQVEVDTEVKNEDSESSQDSSEGMDVEGFDEQDVPKTPSSSGRESKPKQDSKDTEESDGGESDGKDSKESDGKDSKESDGKPGKEDGQKEDAKSDSSGGTKDDAGDITPEGSSKGSETSDDKDGENPSSDLEGTDGDEEKDNGDSTSTADGHNPREDVAGKDVGDEDSDAEDGEEDDEGDIPDGALGDSGEQSGEKEEVGSLAGGAGGHQWDADPVEGRDWKSLIEDVVNQALDIRIKDNNSALEAGVSEVTERENQDVKAGEAPWKPYNPGQDTVTIVTPSTKGLQYDQEQAAIIINSVKAEAAYLRARLRMIVQALEMTSTVHGVPKGKGLSQRFLVDSKVTLKNREIPQKAYFRKGQRIDMSMACAVVLDESGSMNTSLQDCTRIMVALTEPLDALNYPTMVIGFRDGFSPFNRYLTDFPDRDASRNCHRIEGVNYDIFKMWHERFNTVKWRFANTRATGGTPMADGIQYALRALNTREETHRFMFVITDGCPNGGHEPVIKRQLRIAKEAGIHIIGVGMGDGATYVKGLFDDYIWVPNVQYIEAETLNERGNKVRTKEKVNGISLLPKLLIAKLNELVDRRIGFRGKTTHGI